MAEEFARDRNQSYKGYEETGGVGGEDNTKQKTKYIKRTEADTESKRLQRRRDEARSEVTKNKKSREISTLRYNELFITKETHIEELGEMATDFHRLNLEILKYEAEKIQTDYRLPLCQERLSTLEARKVVLEPEYRSGKDNPELIALIQKRDDLGISLTNQTSSLNSTKLDLKAATEKHRGLVRSHEQKTFMVSMSGTEYDTRKKEEGLQLNFFHNYCATETFKQFIEAVGAEKEEFSIFHAEYVRKKTVILMKQHAAKTESAKLSAIWAALSEGDQHIHRLKRHEEINARDVILATFKKDIETLDEQYARRMQVLHANYADYVNEVKFYYSMSVDTAKKTALVVDAIAELAAARNAETLALEALNQTTSDVAALTATCADLSGMINSTTTLYTQAVNDTSTALASHLMYNKTRNSMWDQILKSVETALDELAVANENNTTTTKKCGDATAALQMVNATIITQTSLISNFTTHVLNPANATLSDAEAKLAESVSKASNATNDYNEHEMWYRSTFGARSLNDDSGANWWQQLFDDFTRSAFNNTVVLGLTLQPYVAKVMTGFFVPWLEYSVPNVALTGPFQNSSAPVPQNEATPMDPIYHTHVCILAGTLLYLARGSIPRYLQCLAVVLYAPVIGKFLEIYNTAQNTEMFYNATLSVYTFVMLPVALTRLVTHLLNSNWEYYVKLMSVHTLMVCCLVMILMYMMFCAAPKGIMTFTSNWHAVEAGTALYGVSQLLSYSLSAHQHLRMNKRTTGKKITVGSRAINVFIDTMWDKVKGFFWTLISLDSLWAAMTVKGFTLWLLSFVYFFPNLDENVTMLDYVDLYYNTDTNSLPNIGFFGHVLGGVTKLLGYNVVEFLSSLNIQSDHARTTTLVATILRAMPLIKAQLKIRRSSVLFSIDARNPIRWTENPAEIECLYDLYRNEPNAVVAPLYPLNRIRNTVPAGCTSTIMRVFQCCRTPYCFTPGDLLRDKSGVYRILQIVIRIGSANEVEGYDTRLWADHTMYLVLGKENGMTCDWTPTPPPNDGRVYHVRARIAELYYTPVSETNRLLAWLVDPVGLKDTSEALFSLSPHRADMNVFCPYQSRPQNAHGTQYTVACILFTFHLITPSFLTQVRKALMSDNTLPHRFCVYNFVMDEPELQRDVFLTSLNLDTRVYIDTISDLGVKFTDASNAQLNQTDNAIIRNNCVYLVRVHNYGVRKT